MHVTYLLLELSDEVHIHECKQTIGFVAVCPGDGDTLVEPDAILISSADFNSGKPTALQHILTYTLS